METNFLPVSMWAKEDIPSCKMQELGVNALSTAELISIIIGSGSKKETSVNLSRRILAKNDNCISKLAKRSIQDLCEIYGVGEGKAARILAAIELGKRREEEQFEAAPDLGTPTRIYNYMQPCMRDLDVEEFWALFLNNNYRVIKRIRISHGGITETSVDVRIIMREAVLCNSTILAVCHNHPSGSIHPSKFDDELTRCIKKATEIMRLHFMDHLIITEGAYYSYHEQGKV
jgi:DNA repair protein RadC